MHLDTLLPGGHLTVEGPFFDDGLNTTLTITGGTGRYACAYGSMLLHATGNPVGSEFDFIFTLTRTGRHFVHCCQIEGRGAGPSPADTREATSTRPSPRHRAPTLMGIDGLAGWVG